MGFLLDAIDLGGEKSAKLDEAGARFNDLPAEIQARLLEEARDFISVGHVTPYTWVTLSRVEKDALALAGDAVWSARAAAIGIATQSPRGAANVLSLADNGKALTEIRKTEASAALRAAVRELGDRFEQNGVAGE